MDANDFMDKPTPRSLLEDLVQEAERATEEKQLADRQAWDDQVRAALEQAQALPLWLELRPYAGKGTANRLHNGTCQVYWRIAGEALQMDDFWLISQVGDRVPGVSFTSNPPPYYSLHGVIATSKEAAAFLLERRQVYRDNQEKKRRNRIQGEIHLLENTFDTKPEIADKALATLCELAPDQADEWRELREKWQKRYEARRERIAKEAEEKADREAEARAYGRAYKIWLERNEAARDERERIVAETQALLDEFELTVYRLAYAQVAVDDEDESYLETEGAWVTSDQPDADGYFTVVKHGKEILTKFYHPVKIEGPFVHRAGNGKDTAHRIIIDGGFDLWELPGQNARALLEAQSLPDFPKRPDPPEWMDHWQAGEIENVVQRELEQEHGRLE